MKDEFVKIGDIEKLTGASKKKILKRIHSGELRAFNFGKRCYRILKSDLWAYVQRRKTNG